MANQRKKWAAWVSVAMAVVIVAAVMPWGAVQTRPLESVRNAAADWFANRPGGIESGPGVASVLRRPFASAIDSSADLLGRAPLGELSVTITFNGLDGGATFAGITFPNWTILLLAGTTTALVWLSVTGTWQPPRYLAAALAGAALVQAVLTLVTLLSMADTTVGIGLLTTIAGLATMTWLCLLMAYTPRRQPTVVVAGD